MCSLLLTVLLFICPPSAQIDKMSAYALQCFPSISSFDKQQNPCSAYSFKLSPELELSPDVSESSVDSVDEIVVKVTQAKIDFARLCRIGLSPTPQIANNHMQQPTCHEEAVELDLVIRMNGRCYNATRSLSRIVQLKRDLQQECKTRLVPDLPTTLQQGHRGFAMLKELCIRYAPAVQDWFAKVAMDFHESPALNSFLWQPIEQQLVTKTLNGSKSYSTLGSIPENDGES
jgi:hypothetical protein